jgi:hypothetical protein
MSYGYFPCPSTLTKRNHPHHLTLHKGCNWNNLQVTCRHPVSLGPYRFSHNRLIAQNLGPWRNVQTYVFTLGSIHPSTYVWLYSSLLGLGLFSSLLIFCRVVGLLGRGIRPSQGLCLHTEQHKQNKRTQTSMTRMGFEPTISVFKLTKIVHALDRSTTVIGPLGSTNCIWSLFRYGELAYLTLESET